MPIEFTRVKNVREDRKRCCINCGHRINSDASCYCEHTGIYLPYWDLWDYWCKHWIKQKEDMNELGN